MCMTLFARPWFYRQHSGEPPNEKITAALPISGRNSWGTAHADSPGGLSQFTPPPGDTSVDFLEEVFGSIVGTIHSGGNVEGGKTEDVLAA